MATSPFWFLTHLVDYDYLSLFNSIREHLVQSHGYLPNRHPGSPSFELGIAILLKGFSLVALPEALWGKAIQFLILGSTAYLAWMLYEDLRRWLSPLSSCLAALCFTLHPVTLWHSFSFADDMPGLVIGYAAFFWLRKGKSEHWMAFLLALAISCKLMAVGFLLASTWFLYSAFGTRRAGLFFLWAGTLSFFLYLPALVAFQVDPFLAFSTSHYGTEPATRPAIGWTLYRYTVWYYLPLGFWLVRDWARNRRALKSPTEWVWITGLLLCFSNVNRVIPVGLFLTASTLALWRAWKDKTAREELQELIPWLLILVITFRILFTAPYSRSFLLFALPALLILTATRMKSFSYWLVTLALTFLPMFFYFEVKLTRPWVKVYSHGFYESLIQERSNEYNDFGFNNVPPAWVF